MAHGVHRAGLRNAGLIVAGAGALALMPGAAQALSHGGTGDAAAHARPGPSALILSALSVDGDGMEPAPSRDPIDVSAGVWVPRLLGPVAKPAAARSWFRVEERLGLDDPEPVPVLEIRLPVNPEADLMLSGFSFSTSNSDILDPGTPTGLAFGAVPLVAGSWFDARFDLDVLGVDGVLAIGHPIRGDAAGRAVDLRFNAIVAARWIDASFRLASGGAVESVSDEWLALLWGGGFRARWEISEGKTFVHAIRLHGAGALGPAMGGRGGYVWMVRGGVALEVHRSFDLFVNYRLFELRLDTGASDDARLRVGLQGLFLGATIRF